MHGLHSTCIRVRLHIANGSRMLLPVLLTHQRRSTDKYYHHTGSIIIIIIIIIIARYCIAVLLHANKQ